MRYPRQWVRDVSITIKLAVMVVTFVAIIGTLLAIIAISGNTSTGVRAFIGAEGLWSKGQKDAVYYLARYARTHEEQDYEKYQQAISIPLGDHKARLELQKPVYDYSIVERGLVEGGNAPEDAPYMASLFRRFHDVRYLSEAIGYWAQGDAYIAQLVRCGNELRALIAAGRLTPERQSQMLDRIEAINAGVTPLEHRFSATLGEGARWIRGVLLLAIFLSAAILLAGGLTVSWWISRELRAGILGLREGAIRVSQGDLSHSIKVRSNDELGKLTSDFNDMIVRRRNAEDALRSATEFRDKVMQSASNAIFAIDLQRRFTLVNKRACEITGYEVDELLGSSYQMLYASVHVVEVDRQFDCVASGAGLVTNFEAPLVRKDGGALIITFSLVPLLKDGVIVGVVGTAEDITERKRAEVELAARVAELARSNAELEQFAYIASHDLQAPLRSVMGFAQLLQRGYQDKLDKEAGEYIQFIVQGASHMRNLIQALLAFSKIGRQSPEPVAVNCEEMLAQVETQLQAAIQERRAKITHDPLPQILGSPTEINQLFQNLIGNAIKFQPGDKPGVHVSAQRDGAFWTFSVRDNGVGIKPEHRQRIFKIFQRLHAAEEYEGTGIGLAVCEKIVQRHGGRIWVESEPGTGSTFFFTLPAGHAGGNVAGTQLPRN